MNKFKHWLIVPLLLLFNIAEAAPIFSAASSNAANIDVITASHTAVGSDRYAVACNMNGGATPTSVTYGAQPMTLLGSVGRIFVYGLIAPATGAQTVSADSSEGAVDQILGVLTYTGVHQTTPTGTVVTGTTEELTTVAATVTSATDNAVVDCAMMVQTVMNAAAGQTERLGLDDPGVGFLSFGMSDKPGAASVTMTWEAASTAGDNYIVAVPLVASGGGSPSVVPAVYQSLRQHKH